jgi:hypothetical protein
MQLMPSGEWSSRAFWPAFGGNPSLTTAATLLAAFHGLQAARRRHLR